MKNADKPINPSLELDYAESIIQGRNVFFNQEFGLTKREHFAGLAMQGLISNPNIVRPKESDKEFKDGLKDWCIQDAMLYFYLVTLRYSMIDNRAKNVFPHWAKHYRLGKKRKRRRMDEHEHSERERIWS